MSEILNRWRSLSSEQNRPLQASLELTNRCNERCTHCYIPKFEDDAARTLTKDQWFHVLKELRSAGSLYLILMGGEAMLNPYFWDILKEGARLGFHVSMITNGLLIKSVETAKRLKDSGLSVATVSFYSLDPAIHDAMTTVPGSQKRTKQAIEWMHEAGLQVGVNCLLSTQNVGGYFELADWCIEKGIEVKADPSITPKLDGNMKPTALRMTSQQMRWYYETLSTKWPMGTPQPSTDKDEDYVCNAGKGKCAVTAYGELLTCIEVREPLGLLTKNSFNDLWNGPVAQKWRSFKNRELKDRPEGGLQNFCDHCPGMAKNESGDPLQVSCFSKEQARIKQEVYEHRRNNGV